MTSCQQASAQGGLPHRRLPGPRASRARSATGCVSTYGRRLGALRYDQAGTRTTVALAADGRVVDDADAPWNWVRADPAHAARSAYMVTRRRQPGNGTARRPRRLLVRKSGRRARGPVRGQFLDTQSPADRLPDLFHLAALRDQFGSCQYGRARWIGRHRVLGADTQCRDRDGGGVAFVDRCRDGVGVAPAVPCRST